ncbi:tyrosine-type recombinase/integrase [Streptomyces sp. NRRL F-5123]|uniref:tyrosine-type recombinase/integrase n=1 Tax=Streptomyces sp. NRRL F-5123 TaxID=1463856 RepID=UPI0004E2007B|nr:site-specific integrase [Streptomyces sp. NRRL F-5123]
MASIVERPKKNGETTFQVKWRLGGGNGPVQTERFADPESAETFKQLVNLHKQQWPPGWVRGEGFVEEAEVPNDAPLLDYANRYVDRLTGIDDRTREDYRREIRLHFTLIHHTQASGTTVPASIANITSDDVADWVRAEETGEPAPDGAKGKWLRPPADPKSIRNRHGLLFCVMQAAVDSKHQQLRTDNPCKGSRLPRVDDHVEEEMCFLERDEYARVAAEIRDPAARLLADWLVGTGMRWGEASAVQVRDCNLTAPRPYVDVHRAWKKAKAGSDASFFLGPPKTKKARRRIFLTPDQAAVVREQVTGMPPEAFVFRAAQGGAWRHSNFYHRKWQPAVAAAVAKGLPKRPRIHDLRHTHVAWLINGRIPLPAIQLRLGHESIQTTVDRYGHLVDDLADDVLAAVEAAMAPVVAPAQRLALVPQVS